MQTVAFIGLGTMGQGMAGRLRAAGFPLVVHSRREESAAALVREGARFVPSPVEAARAADVVVAMVPDDQASRAVWLGETGVLAGLRPDAIGIESSTLSPAHVRAIAAEATRKGCAFLDAPVTGSKPQAEDGSLRFLVGGDASVLARATPVLQAMGRTIVHLGGSGSGALMKLINNFLGGVQLASFAEALALIEASGLDRDRAVAVLMDGAPSSPMVKTVAPRMTARDYRVNFALELLRKDLAYAVAEGESIGAELATVRAAVSLLDRAIRNGLGRSDMSAVVEPLRKLPRP